MHKRQGFTLVEMSVVLLVIGLILGGILVGTSMIRNAELQAVLKEHSVYVKALKEFTDKYSQYPGDHSTATTIWGTNSGGCPASYTSIMPLESLTCNGDGNGRIGTTDNAGTMGGHAEWFLAWQHLSNAQLIDGRFTGARGPNSSTHAVPGLNIPESDLASGGWTLAYYQLVADSGLLWGEPTAGYGHLLFFGAEDSDEDLPRNAIMLPADALGIDSKIDDGKPGSGKVRAWRTAWLPNCTENDSSQTAQTYKTSYDDTACSLLFILGL